MEGQSSLLAHPWHGLERRRPEPPVSVPLPLAVGAVSVFGMAPGSPCLSVLHSAHQPRDWSILPSRVPTHPDQTEATLTVVDTSPACTAQSSAFEQLDSARATELGFLCQLQPCVPRGISSPNLPVLTLHPHLARPTQFSGTFPGRAGNKAWFYDSCVNTGWIASVHPASWKPRLPPQRPHRISASQRPRDCREPPDTLLWEHLESPRDRREQKAG